MGKKCPVPRIAPQVWGPISPPPPSFLGKGRRAESETSPAFTVEVAATIPLGGGVEEASEPYYLPLPEELATWRQQGVLGNV